MAPSPSPNPNPRLLRRRPALPYTPRQSGYAYTRPTRPLAAAATQPSPQAPHTRASPPRPTPIQILPTRLFSQTPATKHPCQPFLKPSPSPHLCCPGCTPPLPTPNITRISPHPTPPDSTDPTTTTTTLTQPPPNLLPSTRTLSSRPSATPNTRPQQPTRLQAAAWRTRATTRDKRSSPTSTKTTSAPRPRAAASPAPPPPRPAPPHPSASRTMPPSTPLALVCCLFFSLSPLPPFFDVNLFKCDCGLKTQDQWS